MRRRTSRNCWRRWLLLLLKMSRPKQVSTPSQRLESSLVSSSSISLSRAWRRVVGFLPLPFYLSGAHTSYRRPLAATMGCNSTVATVRTVASSPSAKRRLEEFFEEEDFFEDEEILTLETKSCSIVKNECCKDSVKVD